MRLIQTGMITLLFCSLTLTGCSKSDSGEKSTSQSEMSQDSTNVNTDAGLFKVTFIELGSTRCIPCRQMQPIIDEIEKEYADEVKVIFYDVWTDAGKPYAQQYKIKLIPTQVFLDKDGVEYFRHQGFFPKDEIIKVLQMQGVK